MTNNEAHGTKKISKNAFSRLRQERERRGWTQRKVAEYIGTNQVTVSRWENGVTVPGLYYRQLLGKIFEKSISELGFVHESDEEESEGTFASSSAPKSLDTSFPLPIWNIPYPRNPFFTGREEILMQLHASLKRSQPEPQIQVKAISGLGGIGKTQLALEYAYRFGSEYNAVFWINASTQDTLNADFAVLAPLLGLPEQHERTQNIVQRAAMRWLASSDLPWLLILDNVNDLKMIASFLPTRGTGDVLFTTQLQAVGTVASSIAIEKMRWDEAVLFLLRRTKVIAPDALLEQVTEVSKSQAAEIVAAMDGLPLALDQAGAYIEETRSGLSQYLKLYATRRKELLKRRGRFPINHPDPVTTTWSLSFQMVEHENQAAADLLRLFTFLSPEAIPEEIISLSARELGPALETAVSDPLSIDTIIELLLRYSLVQRTPEVKTLSIHRLVQVVLRDEMERDAQCIWARRAIQAVNSAFPDFELQEWEKCERYFSHVQTCATFSEEYELAFPEAARLFNEVASYLIEYARYQEAEHLLLRALTIRSQILKADHPHVARTLNDLGRLYLNSGRYQKAEHFLQEGLRMRQRVLGEIDPEVAEALYNLASLYRTLGDYAQAEEFYLRVRHILETTTGVEPSRIARCYFGLARLYYDQNDFQRAQKLCEQALDIQEQYLGENSPALASTLSVLAKIIKAQNQLDWAMKLNIRALQIRESISGPNHPQIATIVNSMIEIYHAEGRYREAEPLIARSLRIHKEMFGLDHPYTAYSLTNRAENYFLQGDYDQAESYFKSALTLREFSLGDSHPHTASTYADLARIYSATERYEDAKNFYCKALAIRKRVYGPDHPIVANTLERYISVVEKVTLSIAEKRSHRLEQTE